MWDYMDAQCDGIEHADELATGQRLQNHRVGENTMMGFQHLSFDFDRIISTLKKEKKKLLILNDTNIFSMLP